MNANPMDVQRSSISPFQQEKTTMRIFNLPDPVRYKNMSTDELRDAFIVDGLFQPAQLCLNYIDLDRTVVGSAVPTTDPIPLTAPEAFRAEFFTERREVGVLNIGKPGSVRVGNQRHSLGTLEALYVGRGENPVEFVSDDPRNPAEFYLLSYPAHAAYPTQRIPKERATRMQAGAKETANAREILRIIAPDQVQSCQLVMGFTQLAEGSVWNTMPPHTHMRRSEVYLYFDVMPEERVVHLMGPADETRHLVLANKQAVVSPGWSIHAGVGTRNYKFCWGMGGENQVYTDMDGIAVSDLR